MPVLHWNQLRVGGEVIAVLEYLFLHSNLCFHLASHLRVRCKSLASQQKVRQAWMAIGILLSVGRSVITCAMPLVITCSRRFLGLNQLELAEDFVRILLRVAKALPPIRHLRFDLGRLIDELMNRVIDLN